MSRTVPRPLPGEAPRRPPLNPWRRRFMARMLSVTGSFQIPAGIACALWLHRDHGFPTALAVATTVALHLAAASILVFRLLYWVDDHRTPWWRIWLLEIPYSAYATGCFVALPLATLAIVSRAVMHLAHIPGPSLLELLAPCLAFGLIMGVWGSTAGRAIPVVRTVRVEIPSLHPAFEGYRVVQMSDLHCGPYVPRALYRYWARVALRQRPDLVALTGDLITTGEGYLDDVEDFARGLVEGMHREGTERPTDGVVACMGNHDYFQTVDGVVDALRRAGVRLLRNEGVAVERGAAGLWVAGVDDRWTKRDDIEAALRGAPAGATRVLLAHDPAGFDDAAAKGVELVLSGHTHGGQFGLPWPFERANLSRIMGRYTVGLYRRGASALYVHRGNGITGVPTRVGMWPEVAVLVLTRGSAAVTSAS